jgi:hypothetical protein
MAFPAASLTLLKTVTVYHVVGFRLEAGVKTAVEPEQVTDPWTLLFPVVSVIVCESMDDASIASLNVIVIGPFTETFCSPLFGLVKLTEGGIVSAGGRGPFPQVDSIKVIVESTSIMSEYLFIICLVDLATKITPLMITGKAMVYLKKPFVFQMRLCY